MFSQLHDQYHPLLVKHVSISRNYNVQLYFTYALHTENYLNKDGSKKNPEFTFKHPIWSILHKKNSEIHFNNCYHLNNATLCR